MFKQFNIRDCIYEARGTLELLKLEIELELHLIR